MPNLVNLEVAHLCNLRCEMCTRSFEGVPQTYMKPEVFEKALPDLREIEGVFFAGWGETLMCPYTIDYLRALEGLDYTRGFATNGLLLKGSIARRLLESGAFHVAVSIDAATAESYCRIRGANRFSEVLKTLKEFIELRNEMKSKTLVMWAFVMLRSNIEEMPRAVQLALDIGVDKFFAKQLETSQSRGYLNEALFDTGYTPPPSNAERRRYEDIFEECRRKVKGRIPIDIMPVFHSADFLGFSGPHFRLYLDHQGNLTPCTFITPGGHKPYADNPYEKEWVLGNVMETSIDDMIHSPKYIEFQRIWLNRQVPPCCEGCLWVSRLSGDGLCHHS